MTPIKELLGDTIIDIEDGYTTRIVGRWSAMLTAALSTRDQAHVSDVLAAIARCREAAVRQQEEARARVAAWGLVVWGLTELVVRGRQALLDTDDDRGEEVSRIPAGPIILPDE